MHVFEWSFVAAVLTAASPVILVAIGGALCARAGVFNIALEGQLLWGAFAAVAGSYYTGSAWAGVLIAMVSTTVFSVVLAVGHVWWRADPIILAVGMNLLAVGATGFALRALFDVSGSFTPPGLAGLGRLDALSGIPVLGPVLGRQTVLVLVALALPLVAGYWLARSAVGLRLRGMAEHPAAAANLGVDVVRYQTVVVLASGALGGLAGAQLSLGNVTLFTENMTAGRGWIAVAAVLLAAGRPGWVLGVCLLFGAAEAFGFRLQGIGAPQQLADAAPYIVTVAVLVLFRLDRLVRAQRRGTPEVTR